MTPADWSMVLQAATPIVATVLLPIGFFVYSKRTGVMVTDQQRAAIMGVVTTEAGLIQTDIDHGVVKAADVDVTNPAIIARAASALARAPDARDGQGTSTATAAQMIVARVDTSAKPSVVIVPAA
jgi:hypothetical protein